jgi:hypothetical protein
MNTLKAWMDEKGVTPEEAARIFGKTVGTIRNWRSLGVPASQREWVEQRMAEHTGASPAVEARATLPLVVTREKFRAWNQAALDAGKVVEDWAVDVLDEAAEADGDGDHGADHGDQRPESYHIAPVEIPRAAEEGAPEYSEKKPA